MRRCSLIFLAGVVYLTVCDNTRKLSDGNFRKAINQYLEKHGKACAWIGRPFPIDFQIRTKPPVGYWSTNGSSGGKRLMGRARTDPI
jgi:hypothetical protein